MEANLIEDGVLPFMLGGHADGGENGGENERGAVLRGRLVRIDGLASAILGRHGYPLAASELSAESMALAACLASLMDYDGIFTLQASGQAGGQAGGPVGGQGDKEAAVKTLFADVTSEGAVRGYVQFGADFDESKPLGAPARLGEFMGRGTLALTVDQGDKGRYQGIVPIDAPDLTAVALRYFHDSEQISSALLLAARPRDSSGEAKAKSGAESGSESGSESAETIIESSGWHAAALIIQRIPKSGGGGGGVGVGGGAAEDDDLWHTARSLMATCTRDELLSPSLPPKELLRRLFHELNVAVLPLRRLKDACRCDVGRVERMLEGLSETEKHDLVDADGTLSVLCAFCKTEHRIAL